MREAVVLLVGMLLLQVPLDAAGVGGHPVLHVRHGHLRRPRRLLLLLLGGLLFLDEQEVAEDLGLEVADGGQLGLRGRRGTVAVVKVVVVVEKALYAIERGDLGGQECLHVGVRPVTEMEGSESVRG